MSFISNFFEKYRKKSKKDRRVAKIREDHKPAEETPKAEAPAEDPEQDTANEISNNLEALVGAVAERGPKAPAKHPNSDTSGKFKDLQFGRNYDVHKNK